MSTPQLKEKTTVKKTTPIKSFIYQKPKIIKKETIASELVSPKTIEPALIEQKAKEPTSEPEQEKVSDNTNKEPLRTQAELDKPQSTPLIPAKPLATKPNSVDADLNPEVFQNKKVPNFNVGQQLHSLRNKINNNTMAKAYEEYSQFRSTSGMHKNPDPVPRSKPQLSAEQEKELKTSNYSSELSMTKLDNGACSMTQDLSNVGMEGIKAVSYFSCGESAFDKAFRKHMKKVSDKTKPIR